MNSFLSGGDPTYREDITFAHALKRRVARSATTSRTSVFVRYAAVGIVLGPVARRPQAFASSVAHAIEAPAAAATSGGGVQELHYSDGGTHSREFLAEVESALLIPEFRDLVQQRFGISVAWHLRPSSLPEEAGQKVLVIRTELPPKEGVAMLMELIEDIWNSDNLKSLRDTRIDIEHA